MINEAIVMKLMSVGDVINVYLSFLLFILQFNVDFH